MVINDLQLQLESRYDLAIPYRIEHFVSCDRELADHLADTEAGTGTCRPCVDEEVVFIHQQDDSLEFTVYFDKDLLKSVRSSEPALDELCTVVEGASHALCLLWHAHHERQVRPVDLELQAEIDKYLILTERYACKDDRRQLHKQLFCNSNLVSQQRTELRHRYRTASKLASKYCHWLDARFVNPDRPEALQQELARFYRLSGNAKFEHIRQLH